VADIASSPGQLSAAAADAPQAEGTKGEAIDEEMDGLTPCPPPLSILTSSAAAAAHIFFGFLCAFGADAPSRAGIPPLLPPLLLPILHSTPPAEAQLADPEATSFKT